MKIFKIISDMLKQNTYVVIKDEKAVLIDCSAEIEEIEEILNLQNPKPKLEAIFLTHSHFDHILSVDSVIAHYGCKAYIHSSMIDSLFKSDENLSDLYIPFKVKNKKSIKTFEDEEEFEYDSLKIKCLHTPGHSKDSSCFEIEDNLFTGDTLFRRGVGRTDLGSGDERILPISLRKIWEHSGSKLKHFYPGHGQNFDLDELNYYLRNVLGD